MSLFPPPPNSVPVPPNSVPVPSAEEERVSVPSAEEEREGLLTRDESSFILDAELSKKRRGDPIILAFIESFVRCKNIAQASAEAGINKALGYKIRHYLDVSNAINKLTERSAVKYGFDASEVIERTKEMVDFDPIVLYNRDGTFKNNMYDIPPEARRNIKKMKCKNIWAEQEDINGMKKKIIVGEMIEYEFYDKQKAIELVGKEKELFKNTTKIVHDVTDNMADILLASASRGKTESVTFNNKPVVEATYSEVESNDEECIVTGKQIGRAHV